MHNLDFFDLPFSPEAKNLDFQKVDDKVIVKFELTIPKQSIPKSNDSKSEHAIQNEIQLELSKHKCTIFRVNVGKVRLNDGRFFTTGLPSGFPDLMGFRWTDGRVFFIEVKNAKGKVRPDQNVFHKMLASHDIIHGVARNVHDALMIVDGGLVGYGY